MPPNGLLMWLRWCASWGLGDFKRLPKVTHSCQMDEWGMEVIFKNEIMDSEDYEICRPWISCFLRLNVGSQNSLWHSMLWHYCKCKWTTSYWFSVTRVTPPDPPLSPVCNVTDFLVCGLYAIFTRNKFNLVKIGFWDVPEADFEVSDPNLRSMQAKSGQI